MSFDEEGEAYRSFIFIVDEYKLTRRSQVSTGVARCQFEQYTGCPDLVGLGGNALTIVGFVTFHVLIGFAIEYVELTTLVVVNEVLLLFVVTLELVVTLVELVLVGFVLVGFVEEDVVTAAPTPTQYE